MNRAFVYFGIQCFQLRHVDSVGVFRTGGYIRNLAARTCTSYGYRPVTGLPSINHLFLFFYSREEIRVSGYPFIQFLFCRCFFC